MKKWFFLLFILSLSSFGFIFSQKGDWKENVRVVGVRIVDSSPELKVIYARGGGLGLSRNNKEALQKDENVNARMQIALKDFSVPQVIFDEIKKSFERFTPWKVVQEKEFSARPPDFILDVEVLNYGLVKGAFDTEPRVVFKWKVTGLNPVKDKQVWVHSRKKVSSERNLQKWMSNEAEMVQGELRAHILFAVQDMMYKTDIRKRNFKEESYQTSS